MKDRVPVRASVQELVEFELDPSKKRIGYEKGSDFYVSTVFLSRNHNFSNIGPPVLFETLAEKGGDEVILRYTSYHNARMGHDAVVALIKAGVSLKERATFYGIQTLYEFLADWFPLVEYELNSDAYLDFYRVDKLD